MTHDIFVRAYTVAAEREKDKNGKKPKGRNDGPKWPESVLVIDTETTLDTQQQMTFAVYRRCQLIAGEYRCSEEGVFFPGNINAHERKVLVSYMATHLAEIEVKSFPPKLNLKVLSLAEFVEKVFWKAIRDGAMIVGFNLPFDLSRMAADWRTED